MRYQTGSPGRDPQGFSWSGLEGSGHSELRSLRTNTSMMLTASIRRNSLFTFSQNKKKFMKTFGTTTCTFYFFLVKSRIKQHPLSFSLVTSQTLLPPLFLCCVPCAMFCTAGRVAACTLHSSSGSWCVTLVWTEVYGRIKVSQRSCGPKQIVTSFHWLH